MKKSMRDSLIAAAALIVGGTVLSAAAFGRLDFDYEKLDTEDYREKRYEVEEDFTGISIEGRECDVRLVPSENGECSVLCRETDRTRNTVRVENGTLTIRHEYRRRWFQLIGVSFDNTEITVMLPEESYGKLGIITASGSIEVPEGFTFAEAQIGSVSGEAAFYADTHGALKLSSTSGDLTVDGVRAESLRAETTSGDVAMDGIRAKSLSAETTSGELLLSSAKVTGEVRVSTTSGDMELKALRCGTLRTESTSGDTELADVIAEGRLEAESVSGGIAFDGCDASELRIETTSGDVGGTLLSPKRFETDTVSGEVRAPYDEDGGLCKVNTTSGDIRFRIERG